MAPARSLSMTGCGIDVKDVAPPLQDPDRQGQALRIDLMDREGKGFR